MVRSLRLLTAAVLAALLASASFAQQGEPFESPPDKDGFIRLFDDKTLSGWKISDEGNWRIEDGVIVASGKRSHLFSPKTYKNFEFKADFLTQPGTNSGMYFRAKFGPGWPKGYEAQVNNTHKDPRKTGSLYGFIGVEKQLVKDGEWWTQHIICVGNRIIIRVNGNTVVDYTDLDNTHTAGHLAFQQHDPGSMIRIRNVMVKPLPDDAALEDLPRLKQ